MCNAIFILEKKTGHKINFSGTEKDIKTNFLLMSCVAVVSGLKFLFWEKLKDFLVDYTEN